MIEFREVLASMPLPDEDCEPLEKAGDEIDPPTITPNIDQDENDLSDLPVDYSERGPRDVVVSGPIFGGWGPNTKMPNRKAAYARCVQKYGVERVKNIPQSRGRWAFLIKDLLNV